MCCGRTASASSAGHGALISGERKELMAIRSAAEDPASATIARLTHEYELKDYLDRAWAMRPLDLLKKCGQAVLLLETPDSGPLDRLAVPAKDLGQFLRVAVSLSDALSRMHTASTGNPELDAKRHR